MKTAEEILSKITGEEGIYLTHGMIRGSDALEAMEEYRNQTDIEILKKVWDAARSGSCYTHNAKTGEFTGMSKPTYKSLDDYLRKSTTNPPQQS